MPKLTKEEQKEFKRQRAKWEFELRLWEFIRKYESKEEPSIEFTFIDAIEVMAETVAKNIKKISK